MQSPRATTCNDIYLGGLKVNKTVGPSSKVSGRTLLHARPP